MAARNELLPMVVRVAVFGRIGALMQARRSLMQQAISMPRRRAVLTREINQLGRWLRYMETEVAPLRGK